MNSTAVYRLVPLGLLLLALCSTGLALSCYKCNGWKNEPCTTQQVCDAGQDTCVKVTQKDVGTSLYACMSYGKCNLQGVKEEFQVSSSLSLLCCQDNLCNKGFTGLPASGLILFLASALLVLFS